MMTAMFGSLLMAAEPTTTTATCTDNMAPNCTKSAEGALTCNDQEWLNVETITLEAANGDPIAQYTVAYLTDQGMEMPQNTERAAQMYAAAMPGLEKEAKAGNPAACRALAHMYAEGKGCDKNPAMAAMYARMAKECKDAKEDKSGMMKSGHFKGDKSATPTAE